MQCTKVHSAHVHEILFNRLDIFDRALKFLVDAAGGGDGSNCDNLLSLLSPAEVRWQRRFPLSASRDLGVVYQLLCACVLLTRGSEAPRDFERTHTKVVDADLVQFLR